MFCNIKNKLLDSDKSFRIVVRILGKIELKETFTTYTNGSTSFPWECLKYGKRGVSIGVICS